MNILFDLDGTLTDPYQGITKSIAHALKTMGQNPPQQKDLKWCIGPPLEKSLAKLMETDDKQNIQKTISIYRERFSSIGLFENEVYPNIHQLLKKLQADKHHLYVATSKPTVYAKKIIEHFKLNQYFIEVYGSELDGTRSNKVELLSYILRKERISPKHTCMIGDRKYDMKAAEANGIHGIGVLWGYGSIDELKTYGAENYAKTPTDLYNIIRKIL